MKNLIRYVLNQRGKKNMVIVIAVFFLVVTACGSNEIQDGIEALPATETAEESKIVTVSESHSIRTPFLLTFDNAPSQLTSDIEVLSEVREIRLSRGGWVIRDGNLIEAPWCGFDLLLQMTEHEMPFQIF
tara:strand:+ start:373 stop:762 length:390 start_codon:yes stop_codon:yes gene_type:complete